MLTKLLAALVAATLTKATMGGVFGQASSDGTISTEVLKARNTATWEVYRVFYHSVIGTLKDDTNWPPPAKDPVGDLLGTAGQVLDILGKIPGLGAIIPVPGVLK